MPHFVNASKHYFVSTNYKVLYSLLYEQPALREIKMQEVAQHYLSDPVPSPWLGHFFIVRNPYTRLESFFKDKFRQDPVTTTRTYDELQRCQRFFCSYLRIDPADSPLTIREKLLSLSFAQYVHLLPTVYLLDGHLHPQVNMMTIRFRGAPLQLSFDRVLKIESAPDRAYLQDKLAIDVSQKINNTHQVKWSSPWQPDLYAVVNDLYKADFATFQYEMRTT
jgi:hypothetical protein